MSSLVKLTSKNSAKHIGVEAGLIEVGKRANALLFNPNIESKIENAQSLYDGETLSGEVVKTF